MNVEVYIPEQWPINSNYLIAQSEQEIYVRTEHACKRPSTCERVRYVWTGPPTDIGHSRCERDDSPWQCLKVCNTMYLHTMTPRKANPYIYHAMSAVIPYTMWSPPGHIIYQVMAARPYRISCRAYRAIPFTISCPPGHSIYHARQAISYTVQSPLPCTLGHNHIPCDARKAVPYTMRCPPGQTIPCDARKAIPYRMPPCYTIP